MVTERAVAVIGNLSTSSEYFGALREAGALQRLVHAANTAADSHISSAGTASQCLVFADADKSSLWANAEVLKSETCLPTGEPAGQRCDSPRY